MHEKLNIFQSSPEIFVEEVIFYGLAEKVLESEEDLDDSKEKAVCCRPAERTFCKKSREYVWELFEKPETSPIGQRLK